MSPTTSAPAAEAGVSPGTAGAGRYNWLGLLRWHRLVSGLPVLLPDGADARAHLLRRWRLPGGDLPAVVDEIGAAPRPKATLPEDRAALRRCQLPGEALLTPAFARFVRAAVPGGKPPDEPWALAAAARAALALSRVRQTDLTASLAEQFARPAKPGGDRPRLSTDRAAAFLQQDDPDEALRLIGMALGLLNAANALDAARMVAAWGAPAGSATGRFWIGPRERFALDYYGLVPSKQTA